VWLGSPHITDDSAHNVSDSSFHFGRIVLFPTPDMHVSYEAHMLHTSHTSAGLWHHYDTTPL
jgi:hypothetical protein